MDFADVFLKCSLQDNSETVNASKETVKQVNKIEPQLDRDAIKIAGQCLNNQTVESLEDKLNKGKTTASMVVYQLARQLEQERKMKEALANKIESLEKRIKLNYISDENIDKLEDNYPTIFMKNSTKKGQELGIVNADYTIGFLIERINEIKGLDKQQCIKEEKEENLELQTQQMEQVPEINQEPKIEERKDQVIKQDISISSKKATGVKDEEVINHILLLHKKGYTQDKIAEVYGISRSRVYRILKEHR